MSLMSIEERKLTNLVLIGNHAIPLVAGEHIQRYARDAEQYSGCAGVGAKTLNAIAGSVKSE